MRKVRWIIAVLATLPLFQGAAVAWDGTGHQVVALLAYRQLNDKAEARVKAILAKHPARDFFLEGLPQGADSDQFLFMRVATFPDVIRSGQFEREFNPGKTKNKLHFINRPFVPDNDKAVLQTTPHDPQEGEPHILSALKQSVSVLNGSGADDENRAVELSWLIHLIGDIHQPLHCATLFSTTFDSNAGDEGGNLIRIRAPSSLGFIKIHSYWDELLGIEEDLDSLTHTAKQIGDTPKLQRDQLRDRLRHREFSDWSDESFAAALKFAYHIGDLHAANVVVSATDYEGNARAVAMERVALAGIRLADRLNDMLGHP
jgi:hypothetical protein